MKFRSAAFFAIILTLSLAGTMSAEAATFPESPNTPEFCQQTDVMSQDVPMDIPVGIEEPLFLDGCSAENDCAESTGTPISCTGSTSCSVQFCSVTCDGVRTYCCDISELECPERACVYCNCLATGGGNEEQCSDQACMIFPD